MIEAIKVSVGYYPINSSYGVFLSVLKNLSFLDGDSRYAVGVKFIHPTHNNKNGLTVFIPKSMLEKSESFDKIVIKCLPKYLEYMKEYISKYENIEDDCVQFFQNKSWNISLYSKDSNRYIISTVNKFNVK